MTVVLLYLYCVFTILYLCAFGDLICAVAAKRAEHSPRGGYFAGWGLHLDSTFQNFTRQYMLVTFKCLDVFIEVFKKCDKDDIIPRVISAEVSFAVLTGYISCRVIANCIHKPQSKLLS